jgi:hypothetical protein
MRNGQGPIGNILGFGVGLASETIQYRRVRKVGEPVTQRSVEDGGIPSMSTTTPSLNPAFPTTSQLRFTSIQRKWQIPLLLMRPRSST